MTGAGDAPTTNAPGVTPTRSPRIDAPPHVLVVDDEPDIRHLLREILSETGYAVSTAADATEALRVSVRLTPDLVLLDLILPGTTGWEIAAQFRRPDGCQIPVIVTTAAPKTLFRLPASVICLIPKPFDPDVLLNAIHAALSSAGAAHATHTPAAHRAA